MKQYIAERVMDIANYLLTNKCTIREAAYAYCVSKSTAHKDLAERLPELDKRLYNDVCEILRDNWDERYIRGGEATKQKYKREA
ncbi:MAG: sporulation transcriptional regulator SpoIIID [Clostridia bacterium]|nr:sporulation transcriptional regulator SpoIIID [Clostridia bacterium]